MGYIKKEELKDGDVFVSQLLMNNWLNKQGTNFYLMLNKDNTIAHKTLSKTGGFSYENIRLATSEEKHWLNTCIKLDKFITFEEAMKTFIPEYVECTLQQIGSDYKLGEIYKVSSTSQNVNKIESHNNQGMAFYQMNKHRFKPSTKEAYDAQFVVKEPKFVLPEKWYVILNSENRETLNKWRKTDSELYNDCDYECIKYDKFGINLNSINNYLQGCQEITFEQFKKYVLKEEIVVEEVIEPLPQFKVIETIETITKVENNEGNQFFIGDVVISSNGTIQTIESFDYNKAKTNIIAFTSRQSILGNSIGIDKIEHYIEPKVEETLLEKAKRLYPIGTKFIACNTSEECIITTGIFQQDLMDYGFINEIDNTGNDIQTKYTYHCIYSKGNWAEIIK